MGIALNVSPKIYRTETAPCIWSKANINNHHYSLKAMVSAQHPNNSPRKAQQFFRCSSKKWRGFGSIQPWLFLHGFVIDEFWELRVTVCECIWLAVEQTHLETISEIGSFPQIGMKIKNVWNHHPRMYVLLKAMGKTVPIDPYPIPAKKAAS